MAMVNMPARSIFSGGSAVPTVLQAREEAPSRFFVRRLLIGTVRL